MIDIVDTAPGNTQFLVVGLNPYRAPGTADDLAVVDHAVLARDVRGRATPKCKNESES